MQRIVEKTCIMCKFSRNTSKGLMPIWKCSIVNKSIKDIKKICDKFNPVYSRIRDTRLWRGARVV